MFGAGMNAFPLEPEVDVAIVVGRLHADIDGSRLALVCGDFGFERMITAQDLAALALFLGVIVMARRAGFAARGFLGGALVRLAAQPLVGGLAWIEQSHLRRGDIRPVNERFGCGRVCDRECGDTEKDSILFHNNGLDVVIALQLAQSKVHATQNMRFCRVVPPGMRQSTVRIL